MFFKKKREESSSPAGMPEAVPPASEAEWDLTLITREIRLLVSALVTKAIEPMLVQARFADHYRNLQLEPVLPQQFDACVHGLDGEGWRRLALAVGLLDHPEIRGVLKSLVAKTPVLEQFEGGFAELAKNTDALTLGLIAQSEVRAEEFARHFAAYLGVAWQGESPEQSQARLTQLDYKRLLAEAEQAKEQAKERMEYLRKKQQEDSARRRPRGKQ